MKRVFRSVTAFAFVSVVAAWTAQAQTPVQFGVGGGITVRSGRALADFKTGWNGQALVRFKPATLPVGIQIDGNYHQLKFNTDSTAGVKGKLQIWDGTADVVYTFQTAAESQFHPYVIAGGGIYNVKTKPDVGVSVSQTKGGLNAGAGFDFNVSSAALYIEGRFHNVFVTGPDIHLIPINIGIKFGVGGA
jgi:hypothetical protein